VVNFEEYQIDKTIVPRMPWHDISVRIQGSAVKDLTRHFIQYWNFVLTSSLKKNSEAIKTDTKLNERNLKMNNNKKMIQLQKFTESSQLTAFPLNQKNQIEIVGTSDRLKNDDFDEPKIQSFGLYRWNNRVKLELDGNVDEGLIIYGINYFFKNSKGIGRKQKQ
jgi:phosphatidylserine/phosphatidylglycerophosphate/cardiolipin synthase-like enzyme